MGDKADRNPGSSGGQRGQKTLYVSLLVLVLLLVWLVAVAYHPPTPGKELTFDDLYKLAGRNQIRTVRLLDEDSVVVGERCVAPGPAVAGGAAPESGAPQPRASVSRPPRCRDLTDEFHASYPGSDVSTEQLIEAIRTSTGARITVDKQTNNAIAKHVVTFILPLLMLANLFGIIFMSGSGSGSGIGAIASFGRIGRKRRQKQDEGAVTFADVAGADESVVELKEVIDYLRDPSRFAALGASPPKGVLLFGPPGCGKTLLARATAGESGVPFFSAAGTEFVESLVGVGAARVRDLFRQVREAAPAILFIDEIDAVGRRRSGEGMSGGEREQTLNQLLVELDGFEVTAGVVLMGATNRPDILDPALMRPGRFDRHITLETPDLHGRQAILELHARNRPIAADVDFKVIARRTPGFSGADLANVINEASLLAIRVSEPQITNAHLAEAVMRVLHGPQRRGTLMRAEERRRLAYHESGHAIAAAATGRGDVQRVSVVARVRSLGQAFASDEDGERTLLTVSEMEADLTAAMAGMAAETLVLGECSTAAEDDLERANMMAKEMVGLYGMSSGLGRLRVLTRDVNGYLGGDGAVMDTVSGQTMAQFEGEVRDLIAAAEATATKVLSDNRDLLDGMAGSLEQEETLEGPALHRFLAQVKPYSPPARTNGAGSRSAAAAKAGAGARSAKASTSTRSSSPKPATRPAAPAPAETAMPRLPGEDGGDT